MGDERQAGKFGRRATDPGRRLGRIGVAAGLSTPVGLIVGWVAEQNGLKMDQSIAVAAGTVLGAVLTCLEDVFRLIVFIAWTVLKRKFHLKDPPE